MKARSKPQVMDMDSRRRGLKLLAKTLSVRKAQLLERAIFIAAGQERQAYRNLVWSRYNNLSRNQALRTEYESGALDEAALATMPYEAMAVEEMRAERERINWENILKSQVEDLSAYATEAFQCFRCKSHKCLYKQAQTRSSDEPMTTRVKCTNCGHGWKC